MPRAKAPPRVKGPYSERGGTRFRIRICELTGHRDLYFSTMKDALAGVKEAAHEVTQAGNARALGRLLDESTEDKVRRGMCTFLSANRHREHLRKWLGDYLDKDIDRLTPKRAAALYERLVVCTRARASCRAAGGWVGSRWRPELPNTTTRLTESS